LNLKFLYGSWVFRAAQLFKIREVCNTGTTDTLSSCNNFK
jgi:hypothetical protein